MNLPFDPIDEAARQWALRWEGATAMHAVTSLMRVQQLVIGRLAAQRDAQDPESHVIRSGESIWVLAQQRYNIPIWLLRQYNPDLDLGSVRPGTTLVIPLVEPTGAAEPTA